MEQYINFGFKIWNMERRVILAIILLSLFTLTVSVLTLYLHLYLKASYCPFPLEISLPILSSLGILIGSIVYYIYSSQEVSGGMEWKIILKLLGERERKIIKILRERKKIRYSELQRLTGIPKSTFNRIVKRLEEVGIIKSEREGRVTWIRITI